MMRLPILWFLLPIYSCRTEWTNSMLFTRKSPLQLNYRRTFPPSSLKLMLKMMNWQCETPTCPVFQEAYRKMCRLKQFCLKTRSWFHSGGKSASLYLQTDFEWWKSAGWKPNQPVASSIARGKRFAWEKHRPKKVVVWKECSTFSARKPTQANHCGVEGGTYDNKSSDRGSYLVLLSYLCNSMRRSAAISHGGQQASVTDRVTHYI